MKIENRGTPPEGAQFREERDPKHGSTRAYCGVPGRGELLVYEVSDYFWMVAESMVVQWDDIRKAHPELWLGPITPVMFADVAPDVAPDAPHRDAPG